MIVIAFGHEKRVGKDTAAAFLTTHLRLATRGKSIKRSSFAGLAKSISHQVFGYAGLLDVNIYNDKPELKERLTTFEGKTHRQIWIDVSDKLMEIDPDAFIKATLFNNQNCDVLIINDLRYLNMAQTLRKMPNTYLYKIVRDVPKSDNPTERALDSFKEWNGIIDNNLSIHDLEYQMEDLATQFLPLIMNPKGLNK